jgi:hypothetical protein
MLLEVEPRLVGRKSNTDFSRRLVAFHGHSGTEQIADVETGCATSGILHSVQVPSERSFV